MGTGVEGVSGEGGEESGQEGLELLGVEDGGHFVFSFHIEFDYIIDRWV